LSFDLTSINFLHTFDSSEQMAAAMLQRTKPGLVPATTTIREAAAAAMPTSSVDTKRWWRAKNLRALNILLVVPLVSIFTLGWVGIRSKSQSPL
jgi:hypothetical protein